MGRAACVHLRVLSHDTAWDIHKYYPSPSVVPNLITPERIHTLPVVPSSRNRTLLRPPVPDMLRNCHAPPEGGAPAKE
jgi:hypothetical protein